MTDARDSSDLEEDAALAALHRSRLDFLTWERKAEDIDSPEHQARLSRLATYAGASIAPGAYIAEKAEIHTDRLMMGKGSWIASHALVRGDIELGDDVSINAYACMSGRVRIGNGVRIASHVSIVGFNHGFDDLDTPIHRQPLTTLGIEIGDNVWIGANATIVDGVRIGRDAIIAAGAVVSRDIPAGAIAGGVPARVIRMRGSAKTTRRDEVQRALSALDAAASAEWRTVLDHHCQGGDFLSPDASGESIPAIRHLCDAIEIAAAFGDAGSLFNNKTVARLQAAQDEKTGLFPDPHGMSLAPLQKDPIALYNVLSVGYALECLGAKPVHPFRFVEELEAPALVAWLESLPWRSRAWHSGATVDAIATALYFNKRYFAGGENRHALFGWLGEACDQKTGLWGAATEDQRLLQPVNGFYRLTRGSYAQFGRPVPYPAATIDSIIAHYRAYDGFQAQHFNACNLLDTIHPLLLCLQQTDHRSGEAITIAEELVIRLSGRWQTGRGFAFADGQAPGLQGTEMWLSTLWLAAKLLGHEGMLSFSPKGVHRFQPT